MFGWLQLTLFLALLAGDGWRLRRAHADDPPDDRYEPPFPTLFYDSVTKAPIWPQRAKIVTEVLGGNFRRTNLEYIDLEAGKAAFVFQNGQDGGGSEVLLSDISLDKFYKYKPYTCEAIAHDDPTLHDLDHWSAIAKISGDTESRPRNLRMFGLGAMWMFAARSAKTYSHDNLVFSAGKDLYRMALNWTMPDDSLGYVIRFDFISSVFAKMALEHERLMNEVRNKLRLDKVEILDKSGKVLRTINVLSIEYALSSSDYANILSLPVGYGCNNRLENGSQQQDAQMEDADKDFWSKYLFRSSKVDLEVTATKIDPATSQRATDTLYAEVAHIDMDSTNSSNGYDLLMSKVKSKDEETKTIENHLFNVRYQIDLRRANCTMSHIAQSEDRALELKFSNGLKLTLGRDQFSTIFASGNFNDFQLSVSSPPVVDSNGNTKKNVFMEKTLRAWPIGIKPESMKIARLIRTYAEETINEGRRPTTSSRLSSVTIWVFEDSNQSRIAEIYHFNLIEQEGPLWPLDVPRLFDVSQECYLDNEHMRSGADYAWVEFHYPLASRQLDLLLANEDDIKRAFYSRLVQHLQVTPARVPRFELMFSDEGLIMRALLLDLPEVPLLFEAHANKAIVLQKNQGDLQTIAVDLRHCSKECQLRDCKSMSYCLGLRSCLLGMRVVEPTNTSSNGADPAREMIAQQGCMTYSEIQTTESKMHLVKHRLRLSNLLGQVSHQDYDSLDLPQMPDDVSRPTGDDPEASMEYRNVFIAYLKDVDEYLLKKGARRPLVLALNVGGQFIVLMPSQFVVENDPLDKFDLGQSGPEIDETGDVFYDSNKVSSFFHEGKPMSRFSWAASLNDVHGKASLLRGLSYDQCALGCLESRCGTFSYCSSQRECILTKLSTISEAAAKNLIETDSDCFIAQRDFAKNYQKYPNIERPKRFQAASRAESVSDCAFTCLRSAEQPCMSFEFCELQREPIENCYIQLERQPVELFSASQATNWTAASTGTPPDTGCDHYERSHLAEFNLIDNFAMNPTLLNRLKTTEHLSAITPMDCADTCLNQVSDCSAFQFCFRPPTPASTRAQRDTEPSSYSHSCLTIQSKPEDAQQQSEIETLIDSKTDQPLGDSQYLMHKEFCQIYALRPDTVQGHMRDLAMGNTMSVEERRRLERANNESGFRMSWASFIFMFLSVALFSALCGMGICYARERSDLVRGQLDRVAYQVDRIRSRVHPRSSD